MSILLLVELDPRALCAYRADMDFENMTDGERDAAADEMWDDAHPHCEECHERGCPHGCCDMDGLVMLTDGLIFHPGCLARAQAADAAFGNVEYRGGAL